MSIEKIVIEDEFEDVRKALKQLQPLVRAKRGLINGLGNIVKFITGNLDQSDAEKYDNAIRNLEETQKDMVSNTN